MVSVDVKLQKDEEGMHVTVFYLFILLLFLHFYPAVWAATRRFSEMISIVGWRMLLSMAEDSPHVTVQRMTAF